LRAYTFKTNDKTPSKPVTSDDDVRKNISSRLRAFEGPFRLRRHSDTAGPWRERADAVDKANAAILHGAVGLAVEVRNKAQKGVLCRVVDVITPASVTTGNEKVDEWFQVLAAEFSPGLINVGALVCKTIGSTSTPSQHSNWSAMSTSDARSFRFTSGASSAGGNAIDIAHSRTTMKKIWEFGLDHHNDFDICNLIHWPLGSPTPLIWNEGGGIHVYDVPSGGSNHSDHVHCDFNPTRPTGSSHSAC
jgi:hypothetical protein